MKKISQNVYKLSLKDKLEIKFLFFYHKRFRIKNHKIEFSLNDTVHYNIIGYNQLNSKLLYNDITIFYKNQLILLIDKLDGTQHWFLKNYSNCIIIIYSSDDSKYETRDPNLLSKYNWMINQNIPLNPYKWTNDQLTLYKLSFG